MPSTPRPSRSVLDYDTEDALRKALLAVEVSDNGGGSSSTTADGATRRTEQLEDTHMEDTEPEKSLDWVLPCFDHETTEAQSMKEELRRLQVLKSYLILDTEREEAFERITNIAARVFQVPIALVSLVDLGRQWFMSNRGLGDVRETPRKLAFCAHAIMLKRGILIVPDATKDWRFKDNPLVTGPPDIRFYAGAPLQSPEGYNLGTLCIIDTKIRPNGLDDSEQQTLVDLASLTVDAMVNRRRKLETCENPAQLIAYTAHDLMTPLTGVQLSLSLLKEDEDVQRSLTAHQLELLTTASTCSDLMIRICETSVDSLRKESSDHLPSNEDRSHSVDRDAAPVTKMEDLLKSLQAIMEPIPKQVPLVIRLDPNVPPMILSDDLKLFRSALNLLSSAAARTKTGCIHFRIYPKDDSNVLVFECEDTAENIPVDEYPHLFQPSRAEDGNLRLCLSSVASLISSLDGTYGFAPQKGKGRYKTGSIFWFSVPLYAPDSLVANHDGMDVSFVRKNPMSILAAAHFMRKEPIIPKLSKTSSSNSVSSLGRARMPLTVNDAWQANAVNESCLCSVFETNVSEPERSRPSTGTPLPTVHESMPGGQSAVEEAAIPSATTSAATSHPEPRKRRGLVIDDSLVVRKSLAMALKKLGFEASQAVNGLEGLRMMKDERFDLVLCDFLMPVMDGLDCVKQYRKWEAESRPQEHQLIIGISAHADKHVANQGKEAGMDDFYPKPISIKLLKELSESEAVVNSSKRLDALEGASSEPVARQSDERPAPAGMVGANHSVSHHKRRPSGGRLHLGTAPPSPERTGPKKARTNSLGLGGSDERICLIATDRPTKTSSEALANLEANGWKVVVVHDGTDALRMLQIRNWDAVLVDDDLPHLAGFQCMAQFREWEAENRVNRQKNTFLVSEADVPSPFDKNTIVQPPCGFDYVLRKPVVWNDLYYLLRHHQDSSMAIIMKSS